MAVRYFLLNIKNMSPFDSLTVKRNRGSPHTEEIAYADKISGYQRLYRRIERRIYGLFQLKSGSNYRVRNNCSGNYDKTFYRSEEYDFLKYMFTGEDSAEAALEAFDPESKLTTLTMHRSRPTSPRHLAATS